MKNQYGLDVSYFESKLSMILRDLNQYTPSEMAREMARLSVVANPAVLNEPEFARTVNVKTITGDFIINN